MKRLSAAALSSIFFLSLVLVPSRSASSAYLFEECSCTAPDGSCSASVSCNGGCVKFCGNNDNCSASCSGSSEYLASDVTLEMQNSTYPQFVNELARISGKDLAFSPTKPDMIFNVGLKKATVWDAFKMLSQQGTVRIAGQDFEKLKRLRKSLLSGERFSCCVKGTTVNTFVGDMVGLTGLPLRVVSGNPMATINVKLENVTLTDILNAIGDQTGTKIAPAAQSDGQ